MTPRRRLQAFGLIAAAAVAAIGVTLSRARFTPPAGGTRPITGVEAVPAAPAVVRPSPPYVAVRSLANDATWGRVALVPLESPAAPRFVAPLACLRVHIAAGRGVCLATDTSAGSRHLAYILGDDFLPSATLTLTGPPSRARMSRDGRYAATTVFESGHSYADDAFSTRTTLIDVASGTSLGDLEQFTVIRDGGAFRRLDFNFWGVTFAPESGRFYATLAWSGRPHLVEGDIQRREVRVIAPDVECPSLSPDATRVAFKRREAGGFTWRLWTMRLDTLAATPIAGETRSIDDQVEWLDDRRVLYQFPDDSGNHVWMVEADTARPAERFIADAWSPAVVR